MYKLTYYYKKLARLIIVVFYIILLLLGIFIYFILGKRAVLTNSK